MKENAALWDIYRLTEPLEEAYQGDFSHRVIGDAPLPAKDDPQKTRAEWVVGAMLPQRKN